tara:strand:- start:542 stop:832 length:291 start_codon:yes stop_codon:yes gene_type:complete
MKTTERKHLKRVAELGCIACRKIGYFGTPAEIHHISNKTMSKRSSNFETIPLCPYHHRTSKESYHLNPKWFNSTFGTQQDLLNEVQWLLYGDKENK